MNMMLACPTCGNENSTATGGNDWFCATHYAEVLAQMRAENQARADEHRATRIAGAQKAQATRNAKADGTYRAPRKNMEAYRRIKETYCNRMGW
jgi:hypothetical protein